VSQQVGGDLHWKAAGEDRQRQRAQRALFIGRIKSFIVEEKVIIPHE
jgi:hypothetical protein